MVVEMEVRQAAVEVQLSHVLSLCRPPCLPAVPPVPFSPTPQRTVMTPSTSAYV